MYLIVRKYEKDMIVWGTDMTINDFKKEINNPKLILKGKEGWIKTKRFSYYWLKIAGKLRTDFDFECLKPKVIA